MFSTKKHHGAQRVMIGQEKFELDLVRKVLVIDSIFFGEEDE